MHVAFVDLKRQNRIYKLQYLQALSEVIVAADFIMGRPLEEFEEQFASYCGKKFCVGLNSGTDALKLALIAYGIGPGDEVITPPNSYFATSMVISELGAKPVFVDIDPLSYNIDAQHIEEKITKRTKAILPVHLCGQSADMGEIMRIAQKNNLIVLEDCCQAHGAKYREKNLPISETGTFSFYPGKNLGCFGDGGAVVTDNKKIRDFLLLLRNDGSLVKYTHKIFGFKSRLDNIQARLLTCKLRYLDQWNSLRRQHARRYNELLSQVASVTTPQEMPYAKHVYHLYMIEHPRRDELRKFLFDSGIQTVIHYPTPIHLQDPYKKLGYQRGDYLVTENKAVRILSLPMFPELTDREISYICQKIASFS